MRAYFYGDLGAIEDLPVRFDHGTPFQQEVWHALRTIPLGETISYAELQAQSAERDRRDTERTDSPLLRATDAHLLDTTDLSIEAAVEAACRIIDAALARQGT